MSKKKEAETTHDFTSVINDAIAKSKSPMLKALTKLGPLVKYFHYCQNDEEQYFQAVGGKIFVPRTMSQRGFLRAYTKGTMYLRGEAESLRKSLPEDLQMHIMLELNEVLDSADENGRPVNNPRLQAFNRTIQKEITKAVEDAGGPEILFEEERPTARENDDRVFVQIVWDGYRTPIERRENIRVGIAAAKARNMQSAAKAGVEDARAVTEFKQAVTA